MGKSIRKIINDPVYGFITIDHPLLLAIIEHPFYQRLRRIKQMALAYLVYPGAVHTRLHHSLGAYHLMCEALTELQRKGITITPEEELGAKIAILLHDIGHGPFSHALERVLIENCHHEEISLLMMHKLNIQFDGALETAISIFTNKYPKRFLHQLVSGQLDVDRMDYLTRDSFFSGVSEGVIGYDRIIKMLTVHDGELMVEEKAIYSIEKFLVARRLMFWQVYLHKTVLSSEMMLVKALERVKYLGQNGDRSMLNEEPLTQFLLGNVSTNMAENIDLFALLDDTDVIAAIKRWQTNNDKVLSLLSNGILNRNLLKVKMQGEPIGSDFIENKQTEVAKALGITNDEVHYLVFSGEIENSLYNPNDEDIKILFKDQTVRSILMVDNALIHQNLSRPVKKFYICYPVIK
ncbi:MAG: HD domain-containing protein [Chitinophagaceae bacterium]|nr:HD domain-containing protein [Chitinophagaceae bacterium]